MQYQYPHGLINKRFAFRLHVKFLSKRALNVYLATNMAKFPVYVARCVGVMIMFEEKEWNTIETHPFLVPNVDSKLMRRKNYLCQPKRINMVDNKKGKRMICLIDIMLGKVWHFFYYFSKSDCNRSEFPNVNLWTWCGVQQYFQICQYQVELV